MAQAIRKRNFIAQGWAMLPPAGKAGVVLGAGAGVYLVYRNVKKGIDAKKQKKELEKLEKQFNQPFVVTTGHGQGAIVNLDLGALAGKLHDALNYGPFGAFTDDESILRYLLPVPKPYITSLEYIYKRVYGDNLEEKLRKGMWRYNFNQVRYLFQ